MIPENTMIHIISNTAYRIPSLTTADNNPQTFLFTTSDSPTSNNLRQLTNKFHLLSSSLRNVPTIDLAGRFT
ncbi:hypothetical protein L873DRAFT_1814942 [Choiromyces venosus 120613-1]|uniref:Uncharacterized protein n=1 Tax=Choiromyces venosus 120613-1 TaxID=1336337 RepID=A0A3N4J6W5_9PEZI|nr:hypothetical protein L873DRAFT_1814942 [Choiromyces venosus 120613-1]